MRESSKIVFCCIFRGILACFWGTVGALFASVFGLLKFVASVESGPKRSVFAHRLLYMGCIVGIDVLILNPLVRLPGSQFYDNYTYTFCNVCYSRNILLVGEPVAQSPPVLGLHD